MAGVEVVSDSVLLGRMKCQNVAHRPYMGLTVLQLGPFSKLSGGNRGVIFFSLPFRLKER